MRLKLSEFMVSKIKIIEFRINYFFYGVKIIFIINNINDMCNFFFHSSQLTPFAWLCPWMEKRDAKFRVMCSRSYTNCLYKDWVRSISICAFNKRVSILICAFNKRVTNLITGAVGPFGQIVWRWCEPRTPNFLYNLLLSSNYIIKYQSQVLLWFFVCIHLNIKDQLISFCHFITHETDGSEV